MAAAVVRSGGWFCFLRDRGRVRRQPRRSPLSLSSERLFCTPRRTTTETMERYDPQSIEAKWQQVWADEQSFHVPNPDPAELVAGDRQEVLRARDAPVPVGRPPHGPHARLHDRRRGHALPAPQRLPGAAPDGLRRVRAAGRERRHQGRRAPAPDHRAQHRHASATQMHRIGWGSTGRARSPPTIPATTAGQQWLFLRFLERGLAYRKGRRSSGARTTRRCSRTSRSSTAPASDAARRGRGEILTQWFFRITDYARGAARRARHGSRTGRSRSRRCSATGSAAPQGAEVVFRVEGSGRGACRSSRRAPTRCSARRSSCSPRSTSWSRGSSPARARGGGARLRPAHRGHEDGGRARGDGEGRRLHRALTSSTRSTASGYRSRSPTTSSRTTAPARSWPCPAHDKRDFEFARGVRDCGAPGRRARRRGGGRERPVHVAHRERGARQLRRRRRPPGARGEGRRIVDLARERRARRRDDRLPAARLAASRGSATGAARSRSSTATRAAIVAVPDDQLPVVLPEVEDVRAEGPLAARRGGGLGQRRPCPTLRRAGAARDRHDGHVRRFVLVLPPLPRPGATTRRRSTATIVDYWLPGQPLHRGRRARDAAPALRAVLHQGAERPRLCRVPRAVRAPLQPGDDRCGEHQDVEVARATSSTRSTYVDRYGADTVRMYIALHGPGERGHGVAEDSGLEGIWRFINRIWRVAHEDAAGAPHGEPGERAARPQGARRRSPRSTDDIDRRFSFNTGDLGGDGARQRALEGHARPGCALRDRDGRLADPALCAARRRGAVGRARRGRGCGSSRGRRPIPRFSSRTRSRSSCR